MLVSSATDRRLLAALEQERNARRIAEEEARSLRAALAASHRVETFFRHLTEYALDLITILKPDGTIQFESRSVTKELGWAPEEYVGRNAFEFVHPEDVPRVLEAFTQALASHGSTPILSFRFRHRDGSYRILEGRGNNLTDDPIVAGIVFNSRDVTEQRELEEQMRQSQKVQALGLLTGAVAHDFNNILTAILGYSDLALKSLIGDGVTRNQVGEIRKAGQRAAALTRQLLAFSRKQVLQPRVLNIGHTVGEMEGMLRRLLGEKVDFVKVIQPGLGNILADPGQIEQVLLNLTVNARDAMPEGGTVTVETANLTLESSLGDLAPGPHVVLSLSDTGTGMPPEVQARMFEPFFTTKAPGVGTGLGLSTCHGIIKQSGGHIEVSSRPGEGTTFRIYFPVVSREADLGSPEEGVPALGGTETVLVVDDEEVLRELSASVLQDAGYTVLTAGNGAEALQLLEENPQLSIDLLLTDVAMPVMGGKELFERLRGRSPELRVIFCSGYPPETIFSNEEFGTGVHFLLKPYTIAEVAHKVCEVLAATPV